MLPEMYQSLWSFHLVQYRYLDLEMGLGNPSPVGIIGRPPQIRELFSIL